MTTQSVVEASDSGGSRQLQAPEILSVEALAATAATPRIGQLNVSQNSIMHIGPQFINLTRNVHNVEVVKGSGLGVELEVEARAAPKRRLRCSVAVFVCWALVVAGALAVCLLCALLLRPPSMIDLDITEAWYMRRPDWQAMPAYGVTYLQLPVRYAFIGHSATKWCDERYACTAELLAIQREHQRLGWVDIGPNFFSSGDGLVWEGRGANAVGAMVQGWNSRSVSIMFLGDYRSDAPTTSQLDHVALLLDSLVRAKVLAPDYTLLGQCQVKSYTITPGPLLLQELHRFPHWNDVNATMCLKH